MKWRHAVLSVLVCICDEQKVVETWSVLDIQDVKKSDPNFTVRGLIVIIFPFR